MARRLDDGFGYILKPHRVSPMRHEHTCLLERDNPAPTACQQVEIGRRAGGPWLLVFFKGVNGPRWAWSRIKYTSCPGDSLSPSLRGFACSEHKALAAGECEEKNVLLGQTMYFIQRTGFEIGVGKLQLNHGPRGTCSLSGNCTRIPS